MFSSLLLLSLAAVAPLAYAAPALNSPVLNITWTAGSPQQVGWIDSGAAPTLQQFGAATVELCVGNVTSQVTVQTMGNVDVSLVSSLAVTPDPSVIPPSFASYFIKVTSVNGLDNSSTAVAGAHYMAFSARFIINGGKGQFSPAAQAVISGSSTNTTTTGSTSSTTPGANAAGATTHSSTSTSSASRAGSTTTAKKSSGVGHMVVPHVLSATGVAAIVFIFAFF